MGVGCLGPGNIANATIGRAIKFMPYQIAGAIPGVGDHATMLSSQIQFLFCLKMRKKSWESLHVERGLQS
jgi:hypothetical protein